MLRSDFTATNIPKAADIRHELLRLRTNLKPKETNYLAAVTGVWDTLNDIRVALGGSALTPPTTPGTGLTFQIIPEYQAVHRALRIVIGDTSVAGNVSAISAEVRTAIRVQINDILLDAGWT